MFSFPQSTNDVPAPSLALNLSLHHILLHLLPLLLHFLPPSQYSSSSFSSSNSSKSEPPSTIFYKMLLHQWSHSYGHSKSLNYLQKSKYCYWHVHFTGKPVILRKKRGLPNILTYQITSVEIPGCQVLVKENVGEQNDQSKEQKWMCQVSGGYWSLYSHFHPCPYRRWDKE